MHGFGRDRSAALAIVAGLPLAFSSIALPQDDPLTEPFPAVIELSDLDGRIGFTIIGAEALDGVGDSIAAAGDVNGDGYDDLILGAASATAAGVRKAGVSYVAFGRVCASPCFPALFDLAGLVPSTGLRFEGVDRQDYSGSNVSTAGDFNADGVDDLMIGAFGADPGGRSIAGATYVVFGRAAASGGLPPTTPLRELDSRNGLRIEGASAGDFSSSPIASAGDVNGDGVDDIIIGARLADPGGRVEAGTSYVVFGRDVGASSSFPSNLPLAQLDGTNGFRVDGVNAGDRSGISVAGAGDVNGDGVDDIIIGAARAEPDGLALAGASYVVFGRDTAEGGFPARIELARLDGSSGFRLDGAEGDRSGIGVASAGDVNADGIGDLLIGADSADPGGRLSAGTTYVFFGRDTTAGTAFPASIRLSELDGSTGFRINGVGEYDASGYRVAAAGDVHGDGLGDILIGADFASPDGSTWIGSTFVVFRPSLDAGGTYPAAIELNELDGSNGFRINGISDYDRTGQVVAAVGDLNGDGIDDVMTAAPNKDGLGRQQAGQAYVVYGRRASKCRADLDADGKLSLLDLLAFQGFFDAGDPAADFDEDGRLTLFDFLAFQNAFDAGCP